MKINLNKSRNIKGVALPILVAAVIALLLIVWGLISLIIAILDALSRIFSSIPGFDPTMQIASECITKCIG